MKKVNILNHLAPRLAIAVGSEERYLILLQAFHELVKGDAVALLRKDGKALTLVACLGLSPDALGRCFKLDEHPRLDVICNSKEAVVFPSDCTLADPYDGLIGSDGSAAARVHSCMGLPLVVNRRLIGVLTADALATDIFNALDIPLIETLSVFAGAEMRTTQLIEALENKTEKMCQVSRRLVQDARGLKGGELIGTSEVIIRLRHEIELIGRSDFSVLITGETGAGKEVLARTRGFPSTKLSGGQHMEKSIQGYLGSLQLGEVQQFKNLAMVPAVSDYDDGLGYITLGEALGVGSVEIREVSEGGSVPELRVVNRAGVDGPYPGRAGTRWLQIKSNRQYLQPGFSQ